MSESSITRRDFLNGLAVGVGGAWTLPHWAHHLDAQDAPYPPALTGLRGAHAGSFEALHRLRDGNFWATAPATTDSGESYDVVIVGAGISGLSAAHFIRAARPNARILLLDNHDDFGGHAKRNEFTIDGRTRVGYGGTQSIDSPKPYSAVARGLLRDLDIDVSRWATDSNPTLYQSLRASTFFDQGHYGRDVLVPRTSRRLDRTFLEAAPLSDTVRRDIERLYTNAPHPWPGSPEIATRRRLARMSYADFLRVVRTVDPGVLPLFQRTPHDLFGLGIDAVSAQDAHGLGLPGFGGMGLGAAPGPGQNHDAMRDPAAEAFYYHFPDGGATLARLLVRRLIPAALPGKSVDDSIHARVDYDRLDRRDTPVRLRLSSPVLRVRSVGAGASERVEVTYARDTTLHTVRADRVIMACWHSMIPYLCPELPAMQRTALSFAVKVPLVYTSVLLRNWESFRTLGVRSINSLNGWHASTSLDIPVTRGGYRPSRQPGGPMVVHASRAACRPGLAARDQHRAGRAELLSTPFATIEATIRSEMQSMLGPGGFDAARDILGITVNRWPHGYSYQYNSLFDDFWFNGTETPCEVARRPFGRITIANADAGAYAYLDGAIDQARRAVDEMLSASS
jgi:spermidine dehydrogenase